MERRGSSKERRWRYREMERRESNKGRRWRRAGSGVSTFEWPSLNSRDRFDWKNFTFALRGRRGKKKEEVGGKREGEMWRVEAGRKRKIY
jgi:hypothetical protein